jgi:hypothetical protein
MLVEKFADKFAIIGALEGAGAGAGSGTGAGSGAGAGAGAGAATGDGAVGLEPMPPHPTRHQGATNIPQTIKILHTQG